MNEVETHPPWFDARLPAREDCVLKYMLETRAARHPHRRLALFEDGSSWTYADCLADVRTAAAGLQRLGVRHQPPTQGENTDELLQALEMSAAEITHLRSIQAVA